MALPSDNFTTGPAVRFAPDGLVLSYNGCRFSPLFETNVSGSVVKDNAGRTTKFMEYSITVDGYVTLPDGADTVDGVMDDLRTMLTAHGGTLAYRGRGMDIVVNQRGGIGDNDVAWGPAPELLEFQPLGAGRSAKVQWSVKVRIPEDARRIQLRPRLNRPRGNAIIIGGLANLPLLQFNYDTSVSYTEDGYSSISVNGTLEVAMTRRPDQATRTLVNTVDDVRGVIEDRLMGAVDLSRFKVVRRNFSVSRDKRTLEWSFGLEEKPYMDLPPGCSLARGTYSVRPAKAGMGLCTWLCTLRATYTVRADQARRVAWLAFLTMLRKRMRESKNGVIPKLDGEQNPLKVLIQKGVEGIIDSAGGTALGIFTKILKDQDKDALDGRKAWLIDFSFDEGLYLDSKTVSFSATWRLVTIFSHIMLASGLWTKLPEDDGAGNNLWATSMKDVSGSTSWLPNKLDPKLDVIVDFGGG